MRSATFFLACVLACSCSEVEADPPPPAAALGAIALPGVEHFYRWSEHVAQGGTPEGERAFQALVEQGITTILSVDGAIPDIETAARYGLSYVHVPIGYDGISGGEQARIVRAVQLSRGPVYVHCHHGLHRGPAAAAIARMAVDRVANEAAVAGLKESGCSPAYEGLFQDVGNFEAPSAATLDAIGDLPSAVKPGGIQDAMVHVDDRWDFLKTSQAAGWVLLPEYPDVSPVHEAGMLREQFRELARVEDATSKGEEFLALLRAAEERAADLESALREGGADVSEQAWTSMKQACQDCHVVYRD